MQLSQDSTRILRAMIRWTSGVLFAVAIIAGSCLLSPSILGNYPALMLTSALALIIGLQVALPPINSADDWIRLGLDSENEIRAIESPVRREPVKRRVLRPEKTAHPPSPLGVQPLHLHKHRAQGNFALHRDHHLGPSHHKGQLSRARHLLNKHAMSSIRKSSHN